MTRAKRRKTRIINLCRLMRFISPNMGFAEKLAAYDNLKLTAFAQGATDSGYRKISKPGNDIAGFQNL